MYGFFDKYNALFVHLSQQESYHIFVQKHLNIDSNKKNLVVTDTTYK